MRTCRAALLAVALTVGAPVLAQPAARNPDTLGLGIVPCGVISTLVKTDPGRAAVVAWMQGYVSGFLALDAAGSAPAKFIGVNRAFNAWANRNTDIVGGMMRELNAVCAQPGRQNLLLVDATQTWLAELRRR